ncbi:MAG: T9SS type A sorting domain-containing protein [Saprospiraceae bacterium]|jgi:hypothetical protein|nr:T9SS type A sorting domain-containing protein [Saprospiraceae bacterium]
MKKTLLLLLVWLLQTNPAAAQGPGDYQFQFQFDNYLKEWVQGPDGAWFGFGHSNRVDLIDELFVLKWDAENDVLLWKTNVYLPAQEVMHDLAMLPAPDGGVFVGAVYDGCDYPTPEGLARLSADGQILWTISTPEEHRFNNRLWLLPATDGKVIFQTDKFRFEYQPDGTLSSMSTATGFPWSGFVKNSLGGYLAYGNQALGSFSPFFVVPFPDNVRHVAQPPGGEWFVLGSEKLYRLDAALTVQAEKSLAGLQAWSKVFWADSACWVTGSNTAGASVLHRIDPVTLDILDTYAYDKQYQVLALLHTPGDSVLWLSGNCNFPRNRTVFLKSVPKDNPVIEPTHSVALTGIRLEQQPTYATNSFPCTFWLGPSVTFFFGKVFATVTNTGSNPVSKFLVNGRFSSCWNICEYQDQFSKPFEATLMPGESAEVHLSNAFSLSGTYENPLFTLCFWTALPDDRLDAVPEDDRYCETFSVIVSDDEPATIANAVRVSPNPARDQAIFSVETLDADDTRYRIILTNTTGQVMLQTELTGPTWTLETGAMPTGLYFYQITGPNDLIGSGRLVISR